MAIFLDNECTVYTNQKSFSDIPSYYIYNNANLYTQAQSYIEYSFSETTSCAAEQEFDSPYNQKQKSHWQVWGRTRSGRKRAKVGTCWCKD